MSDAAKRGDGPRVVVIGGGIAGLAAAHRLTRLAPEATITLVEAADRLGGKILTERRDGFIIEAGPEALLTAKPHGLVLCRELGLDERLLEPNAAPRRTFIRRDGRLHPMPEGLTGLAPTRLAPIVRTRLLSPVGKARVALEWLLPPRRDAADETLGDFIERRLGREFFDRLVAPLVGGIYGGDARPLSLAAAFPQLRQAEQTYGGLARAALARRSQPGGGRPASFVTPRTGLTEVVDSLTRALDAAGVTIALGTAADRPIERAGASGYAIGLANGQRLFADVAIVAAPAPQTAKLLERLDPEIAAMSRRIPHVSAATVALGYAERSVSRPLAGHGYVISRDEDSPLLACTWTSAKWPGRAPAGFALFRVTVGDAAAGLDDDAVLALARRELGETLGISAAPALVRIARWPAAMPQYTLGHLDRVAAIDARLARHPGLALAGAAYRGVGLADCIASGEAAAERIGGRLGGPAAREPLALA